MWACLFATGTSCADIWRPCSIDPILHLWHSSFCLSGFLVTGPAVLFIWFSEFFIFNASGLFCFAFQKSLFPCWLFCVADFSACIADLLHFADFFFLYADVPLYVLTKFIYLFLSSFRLLIIFTSKLKLSRCIVRISLSLGLAFVELRSLVRVVLLAFWSFLCLLWLVHLLV